MLSRVGMQFCKAARDPLRDSGVVPCHRHDLARRPEILVAAMHVGQHRVSAIPSPYELSGTVGCGSGTWILSPFVFFLRFREGGTMSLDWCVQPSVPLSLLHTRSLNV